MGGGVPAELWVSPLSPPAPSLLTAYDEHQKMLKLHAGRKRPPENG